MRKTIIAVLLSVAALSYLEALLPGGLPLGNVLAALSLCSVAGAAVGLSARGTALQTMAPASLLAAAAWLPASIVLAGNLALNFSGGRGTAWLALSLAAMVGVLTTLLWTLAASPFAKYRRAGAA